VEVFQPRDWQLIDGFARKATGLLLNADVPTDFYASITLRLEHDFNSEHRLLHPHPEVLEAGLGEAMPEFLAGLADKVAALGEPDDRLVVSRPDVNLELETTFESVAPSGEEPDRAIAYGYSVSAYSPEWIFGDILRRIRSKAGERQAGGPGEPRIRLLIVDLSTSPISAHLDDEIRRPRYDQLFDDIVRPCAPDDYDVIALCEPSWEHGLSPRFVAAGDTEHVGLLN
jgi:hypothetical protein